MSKIVFLFLFGIQRPSHHTFFFFFVYFSLNIYIYILLLTQFLPLFPSNRRIGMKLVWRLCMQLDGDFATDTTPIHHSSLCNCCLCFVLILIVSLDVNSWLVSWLQLYNVNFICLLFFSFFF